MLIWVAPMMWAIYDTFSYLMMLVGWFGLLIAFGIFIIKITDYMIKEEEPYENQD